MASRRSTRTGRACSGRSENAASSRSEVVRDGWGTGDPAGERVGHGAGDPYEHARQICLRLLAARPRTRAELAAALRRKGVDDETALAVLDRLSEVKLVDDEALAESVVHAGHAYQGLGRRALAARLRRRGVDEPTTSAAVSAVDRSAEEQRARELVRRRLPAMASVDEATVIRRLVSLLARKGYPPGLSYAVVREELRGAGRDTALLDDTVLQDDGAEAGDWE
jgi:regulatory protein